MKILFIRSTYFLSDLIIGLNITCTWLWNAVFARDIQPVCAVFELETLFPLGNGARHLYSFIST